MGKTITKAEMQAQADEGDSFNFPDTGIRSIAGFQELIAQIRELVAAQRANAGADMLRSEANSELIAALQRLMSRPIPETDMSVVAEALTEISALRIDPAAYEFHVVRDNQGFMTKITANPVTPTLN